MSTYKPLSDEELQKHEYEWTISTQLARLEEQARRANALIFPIEQMIAVFTTDSMSMAEIETAEHLKARLRSYLGELAPAEGGGRHDV